MTVDIGWLERQFQYSERHGIPLPYLTDVWDELNLTEQTAILAKWEMIRGNIPERIIQFEMKIREKTLHMFNEEDFAETCRINDAIADLASVVNDLNIWFRTQQDIDSNAKQHSG